MKLKKLCVYLLIFTLVFLVHIPSASASDVAISFTDFENCSDTIQSPWVSQGHSNSAPVADTSRGKSAVLQAGASAVQEIYCDYTATTSDVKTIVMRYAMYFDDLNVRRSLYTRSSTGGHELIQFTKGGAVVIGATTMDSFTYQSKKWYDMLVTYIPSTGEIRLTINDSATLKTGVGYYDKTGLDGFFRINFVAQKADSGIAYIDDVSVHTLSYISAKIIQSYAIEYSFDDFVSNSAGSLAPDEWLLQNTGSGNGKAFSVAESDRGKSVKLIPDGTKHFEMVKNFTEPLSGNFSVKTDLKIADSSGIYIAVQGNNAQGSQVTGPKTRNIVQILPDGTLKINGSSVGDVSANVWYRLEMSFSSDGQYHFSASAENQQDITYSGTSPGGIVALTRFEFYAHPDIGPTQVCVDNLSFAPDTDFGVTSVSTGFGATSKSTDEIHIAFSDDLTPASISQARFSLNGDASYISNVTIMANKMIAKLVKPLDYGTDYIFEASNILSPDGDEVSVMLYFFVEDKFIFDDYAISSDGAKVSASAKVRATDGCEYDVTLLLAMYNKTTGEMVDLVVTTAKASASGVTLLAVLPVPMADGEYEVYSYIWDGADTMQSLTSPKVFDIN